MTKKIILDTDPGIDDAMAILFAEAHPDIDLMAITTVYGNATIDNATQNALYLKQKFGMKALVAKGADKPLVKAPVGATVVVHGEAGFGDVKAPSALDVSAIDTPAYQFIIDSVRAEPGEITLVAVGPLTNLALALEADPEIVNLVKEVVVMGGAFGENDHRAMLRHLRKQTFMTTLMPPIRYSRLRGQSSSSVWMLRKRVSLQGNT